MSGRGLRVLSALARQAALLVAVLTLGDVLLVRLGEAVGRGGSGLLAPWSRLADRVAPAVGDLVLLAVVVALAGASADLSRERRGRVAGALTAAAAAWILLWRAGAGPALPPAWLVAGLLLGAAARTLVRSGWPGGAPEALAVGGAALAAAGEALASAGAGGGLARLVPIAAETLLPAGAALTLLSDPPRGRRAWLAPAAAGVAVALPFVLSPAAARSVLAHTTGLGRAAVHPAALAGLLALAAAGCTHLAASGPRGRGRAVLLAMVLVAARRPGPSGTALRVWLAASLLRPAPPAG